MIIAEQYGAVYQHQLYYGLGAGLSWTVGVVAQAAVSRRFIDPLGDGRLVASLEDGRLAEPLGDGRTVGAV